MVLCILRITKPCCDGTEKENSANQEVKPNLNREPVKTAFFGEPEPNLNRLNLRSLNLNQTRTFNISNL